MIRNRFAVGLVAVLAVLVCLYLFANYRKTALFAPDKGNLLAVSVLKQSAERAAAEKNQLAPFASEEEFKSYIDDGKRANADNFLEAQAPRIEKNEAPAAKLTPAAAGKIAKQDISAVVSDSEARRYFSLGSAFEEGSQDILQAGAKNIYYSTAGAAAGDAADRETRIIETYPAESLAQTGLVSGGGDLLLSGRSLFVFRNNNVDAFDVSESPAGSGLWKARIGDGSRVIGSSAAGSKLYLVLKTAVDAARPCPIKPLEMESKPLIIECGSIYRPNQPVLVDSIFTIFEIDHRAGALSRNISFVGGGEGSAAIVAGGSIYAIWGKGGDYVSFFTGFLNERCASILPRYLLEKASQLPDYDISRAAKEMELRTLLLNWIGSLDPAEQARINGEIVSRMADYLRSNYLKLEKTDVAVASLADFKFAAQNEISGMLASAASASESGGNLRLATVSGKNATEKMAWLAGSKTGGGEFQNAVSNIYVLDESLNVGSSHEGIDLPSGICEISFSGKNALASVCLQDKPFYTIGLSDPSSFGLKGEIKVQSPSYLRFLSDDLVLAVSNNNRKIKILLFDISLPAKPELKSEFDLNDYWADLDNNYRAFSASGENKQFFLPSDRGGYVFSYDDGVIALKKTVGNIAPTRSFFSRGSLYLVGEAGIEVFGSGLEKIKSLIF